MLQAALSIFARYQPLYAEHQIATFPVDGNKTPCVRGYLKAGREASAQLALKFPDANAFGFACGPRNKISVLDVDTNDECVLADALAHHGPTPLIVRTGSGNFHAYYRHGGERRKIRPDPSKPIDILGGGFVVAPPSRGANGAYNIIEGSLDDLDRLPRMRPAVDQDNEPQQWTKPWHEMRVGDGRNDRLLREVGRNARYVDTFDALLDFARTRNSQFCEPMTDAEVVRVTQSVWVMQTEGRNWFGIGNVVTSTHVEIDRLLRANPDAFILLTVLKRHHWGRDFYVANALAPTMPGGGWTRHRLAAARKYLLEQGRIVEARPRTHNTPTLFRWPKS